MEVKILEHLRERDLESTSNVDADVFTSLVWQGSRSVCEQVLFAVVYHRVGESDSRAHVVWRSGMAGRAHAGLLLFQAREPVAGSRALICQSSSAMQEPSVHHVRAAEYQPLRVHQDTRTQLRQVVTCAAAVTLQERDQTERASFIGLLVTPTVKRDVKKRSPCNIGTTTSREPGAQYLGRHLAEAVVLVVLLMLTVWMIQYIILCAQVLLNNVQLYFQQGTFMGSALNTLSRNSYKRTYLVAGV